mgnify:CR=1 FL=1
MNIHNDNKLYDFERKDACVYYTLKNELQPLLQAYFPTKLIFKDTNKKEEIWLQNGVVKRDHDLPSIITYYESSKKYDEEKIKEKKWMVGTDFLRENDESAYIEYYENGKEKAKYWYENGKINRSSGFPAVITFYKNGYMKEMIWYKNNKIHRDQENENEKHEYPAYILHHKNSKRVDHCACCDYNDETDIVHTKKWYTNGKLHRENKPAVIYYDSNENPTCEQYYKEGVYIKTEIPVVVKPKKLFLRNTCFDVDPKSESD